MTWVRSQESSSRRIPSTPRPPHRTGFADRFVVATTDDVGAKRPGRTNRFPRGRLRRRKTAAGSRCGGPAARRIAFRARRVQAPAIVTRMGRDRASGLGSPQVGLGGGRGAASWKRRIERGAVRQAPPTDVETCGSAPAQTASGGRKPLPFSRSILAGQPRRHNRVADSFVSLKRVRVGQPLDRRVVNFIPHVKGKWFLPSFP